MARPNCAECGKLFDTDKVKRVIRLNICYKCRYNKDKAKFEGVTAKMCKTCKVVKPCSKFRSKLVLNCLECNPRKPFDFNKGAKCSKCKTTVLTPENKVKHRLCCKKCRNIAHKHYTSYKYRKTLDTPPIVTKITETQPITTTKITENTHIPVYNYNQFLSEADCNYITIQCEIQEVSNCNTELPCIYDFEIHDDTELPYEHIYKCY